MRKKDRCPVVLDTSVIVSALWQNASQRVVQLWKHGFLQLIVAPDLVEEYLRVLERMGVAPRRLQGWRNWFAHPSKTTLVTPGRRFKVCRDPNDDMFLDAATVGRADYLIARDPDLLVLGTFRGVSILTPEVFMEKWEAGDV